MEKDDTDLIKKAQKIGISDIVSFERVIGGWISHPPLMNSKGDKIIGQQHYAIVDGEEKTLWVFPSAVPPTRIREALAKKNLQELIERTNRIHQLTKSFKLE